MRVNDFFVRLGFIVFCFFWSCFNFYIHSQNSLSLLLKTHNILISVRIKNTHTIHHTPIDKSFRIPKPAKHSMRPEIIYCIVLTYSSLISIQKKPSIHPFIPMVRNFPISVDFGFVVFEEIVKVLLFLVIWRETDKWKVSDCRYANGCAIVLYEFNR